MSKKGQVLAGLVITIAAAAILGRLLSAHQADKATKIAGPDPAVFAAAFDAFLLDSILPVAWGTRLFTPEYHVSADRTILALIVDDARPVSESWYALPYQMKKNLVGSIYLALRYGRIKAGGRADDWCQVKIADKWGEVLAECSDPNEVNVYR